ncbi:MAG: hypothetical protein R3F48_13225 [Candidatus Zixiibacteriota bacterium]
MRSWSDPKLKFAFICLFLLVSIGIPMRAESEGKHSDSVSVREPEAPPKGTGEILLAIPSTILKTPVYLLKGITWGIVQGAHLPIVGKIMRFDNPMAPFYLVGGYGSNKGFSGGTGFGFYNNFVPDDKLKFEWYYSTYKYQSYRLKYRGGNFFGNGDTFNFRAEYKRRPHEYFYGMGNNSDVDDETCYTLERSSITGGYQFPVSGSMVFGLHLGYHAINIFDGEDDDSEGRIPVITEFFNLDPSIFRSTETAQFGFEYMYDTRQTLGRITEGVYGQATVDYYCGVGRENKPEFLAIGAEAGWYVNLFSNRILAIRGIVQRMRNLRDESSLPFAYLSSLGGRDDLRGFRGNRLVDKDAALVTVEYRYPLWTVIDAFVFIDEGRVFSSFEDELTFKNWHESYGVGLRIFARDEVIVRTQLAIGDEAPRIYFELGATW